MEILASIDGKETLRLVLGILGIGIVASAVFLGLAILVRRVK